MVSDCAVSDIERQARNEARARRMDRVVHVKGIYYGNIFVSVKKVPAIYRTIENMNNSRNCDCHFSGKSYLRDWWSHTPWSCAVAAQCYTADSNSFSDRGYPGIRSHSKKIDNRFKGESYEQELTRTDDQTHNFR